MFLAVAVPCILALLVLFAFIDGGFSFLISDQSGMAGRRKTKRKRSRSRSTKGNGKKGRARRRSRGGFGGGKVAFSMMGKPVAMPAVDAAWLAGAMLVGEIITEVAEGILPFELPEWVPDSAAGLFAYGWYYRDLRVQQFAYALALADAADDTEVVESIKDTALSMVGGIVGSDDDDDDDDELTALPSGEGDELATVINLVESLNA